MTSPPRIRPADDARTLVGTAVDQTDPEAAGSAEQKFSLSATQVMASMAAAVTAALVGSRLGVAGTVIGAGIASVISVVGGAVIGHSILLTRQQVKRAVSQVRGSGEDGPAAAAADQWATVVLPAARSPRTPADDYTTVIPAVTRLDLQRASQDARTGPGHAEPGRPRPTRPSRPRVSTGVLLGIAASLAIFVSALGAITVFETIKGSPLSGGESGGLSVLGGNGGNPVDIPATTSTTVITAPSTVTQTVTSEVTSPATTAPATTVPATTAPATTVPPTTVPATTVPATTAQSPATQPSAPTAGSSAAVPNAIASSATGSGAAGPR